MKFRHIYRKSGLPSKNTMSDFASEVAKYPESSPKPENSAKYCASVLSRSVKRCSLFSLAKHSSSERKAMQSTQRTASVGLQPIQHSVRQSVSLSVLLVCLPCHPRHLLLVFGKLISANSTGQLTGTSDDPPMAAGVNFLA